MRMSFKVDEVWKQRSFYDECRMSGICTLQIVLLCLGDCDGHAGRHFHKV